MIVGVKVLRLTSELKQSIGDVPAHYAFECEYALVDERGAPVGASGKYSLLSDLGVDALKRVIEDAEARIHRHLFDKDAPTKQTTSRLVPLRKDE